MEDLAIRAIWLFLSQNWKLASRKKWNLFLHNKVDLYFPGSPILKVDSFSTYFKSTSLTKSNILGQRPTQTSVWATIKMLLLYFLVGHWHVVCSYTCPYRWHCCIAYSSFPFLFSFMPLSAFLSAVNLLIKDHSLLTPHFSSLHLKPAEPSFSMRDPLINFKPQTIDTKVTMSL